MKFKENFKRFMTLDRHHDGGFTLVELIVVIAILAILAGIGVPAYSSYIGKANLAADQQVIDIVNTCFAAAAADSWMSVAELEGSTLTISNGEITGLVANNAGDKKADIEAAFLTYFKGGSLKTVSSVAPSGPRGFSIGGSNGGTAGGTTSGGKYSGIFAALGDKIAGSIDLYQDSEFANIGAKELLNKVDTVTGLAAGLAADGSIIADALAEGIGSLAERLDYTTEEELEEFADMWDEMVLDRIVKNGGDTESTDDYNKANAELLANYAVLEAAKNSVEMASTPEGKADLLASLREGISADEIKGLLGANAEGSKNTSEGIAKTATLYALYTAYANQLPEGTDEEKAAKQEALALAQNPGQFATTMGGEGFQAYLQTANAEKDLDGYLAAMDIINQSANEDPEAILDLIQNGYNDPSLGTALEQLLGK